MADLNLKKMAALVIEIERLRWDFEPMPDTIMDNLSDARFALEAMVMNSPSGSMTDVCAKLQMLAATNRDENSFHVELFDWLAVLQSEATAIARDQFGIGGTYSGRAV